METKPEVNEQQPEATIGGVKMETLAKFLELITLQNIREEREKNDSK